MSKSLIIVESPAKTKTLKNFLGSGYIVEASMGHVRDLPKSTLGIDVDNDFAPHYISIPERRDVIKRLKDAVKKADTVYLAADPDREGEAIAWHLNHALGLDKSDKPVKRIRFNAITESAVKAGLENADEININLVNAQQARRLLDRLVGYKLSPLLWKKIKSNLSAGRVQSVAVRLVCDREREIEAFVPEEYWSITAVLTPHESDELFEAHLVSRKGKKVSVKNEDEANKILKELEGASYIVKSVKTGEKKRSAPTPFITSTLQQEANRKLGFTSRKTMLIAQHLYEGISLGSSGSVGLITYMRTDSMRIAPEAQKEARDYIKKTYGSEYVPEKAKHIVRKGAQDAHEAIRPTSVFRAPESIKQFLNSDEYKLYSLIWKRFVASQMAPAVFNVAAVDIEAGDCVFRANGSSLKFPGFMKIYIEGRDDNSNGDETVNLPVLNEGDITDLRELRPKQHFTEPPPRYTEATLVRALEEKGIGRPSTYASIISTVQDRRYLELVEKKFRPTELGFIVNDKLVEHFPKIMDVKFTAGVESALDEVEEGKLNWIDLLRDFYDPFEADLKEAGEKMEKVKIEPKVSDEVCPNCGKPMLIRESRFGEFLGCSGYPECKTTMPIKKKVDMKCPVCGEGDILERMSKKRKVFYGCSRYPECTFASWDKPTDKKCPECGQVLGEWRYRNKLIGYRCTNKDCGYKKTRGKGKDVADKALKETPKGAPVPDTAEDKKE